MKLRELDDKVSYLQQLQDDEGEVVLINQFNLAPEDAEPFLEVWADDAAFMKQQPGFISTQLHRGTAGQHDLHQRGRLGVGPGARPGVRLTRVPGPGRTLPGQYGRRPPRVPEGRRPGHLRGMTRSARRIRRDRCGGHQRRPDRRGHPARGRRLPGLAPHGRVKSAQTIFRAAFFGPSTSGSSAGK